MLNLKKHSLLYVFLFCLLSFLGGAINGFVGTGGGIIFVFMLSFLTKNDKRDNFATTVFCVILLSLIGFVAYFRAGSVDISTLSRSYLPAITGGVLGAFLFERLRIKYLNIIFGALVIYSGASLLFS